MAAAFRFVQCPSQLARTRRRGTATGPIAAVAAPASQFHAIDRSFPGIEVAIEEPPVFVVRGALSNDACDALVKAAEAGQMPPVSYDNSVHLDMHRLRPLPLMVAVGAAIPAWHAAEAGGDAAAVLAAFAGAAAVGGASVAALCWAAVEILQATVGRNIFTGSKWNAARVEGDIAAERAVEDFFRFVEILLSTSRDLCERPLVTRYAVGEEQKVHLDARPAGDASMAQFEASGGQRLVQIVVYIKSPEAGGETRFHHPALNGFAMPPTKGDALVFFPAYLDGTCDSRMTHSGEPVIAGEKWILNTWVCQRPPVKQGST